MNISKYGLQIIENAHSILNKNHNEYLRQITVFKIIFMIIFLAYKIS